MSTLDGLHSELDAPVELPETVAGLMERVYEAQDIALLRRRRAGWEPDAGLRVGRGR